MKKKATFTKIPSSEIKKRMKDESKVAPGELKQLKRILKSREKEGEE